jgi:hypothetical protein
MLLVLVKSLWRFSAHLLANRFHVTISLVTLSLQMLSEICLDKSLSLQTLAALLGKDERTVSRWCERGFVPGAYRMRGGEIRRGKWRVRFPKRNETDRNAPRFSCNRHEGWTDDQISRCRALDRFIDRIIESTRGFRRSLRYRVAGAPSPQQIDNRKVIAEMARLSEERAMTGEPEGAPYHDALVNLYFGGQTPKKGEAYVYLPGVSATPQGPRFEGRSRAPRISRDLMTLARAKGMHNHNEGARRALTMQGLARALGLPMSWVRRDADLRRLLSKQIYEANLGAGVAVFTHGQAKHNGKVMLPRDTDQFWETRRRAAGADELPVKTEMHRQAAAALREWLRGLTPEERAKVPADTLKDYGIKPHSPVKRRR